MKFLIPFQKGTKVLSLNHHGLGSIQRFGSKRPGSYWEKQGVTVTRALFLLFQLAERLAHFSLLNIMMLYKIETFKAADVSIQGF